MRVFNRLHEDTRPINPSRTLEVEDAATKCLNQFRQPRTPGKLRSFLGLYNSYRRFVNSNTDI